MLITSKTKQFCKTSFKNGKLRAALTASYQCVLRFFQSICLNYCACHEKVMPGHTKCCTCHSKWRQQTWRSQAPICNPSQEISARTSYEKQLLWTCLLCCTCHGKCIFADPLPTPAFVFGNATKPSRFAHFWQGAQSLACHAKRHLNVQKWREHVVLFAFWLRNVLPATTACTFSTSQLPKVVREWCALYILTSKCASRHNGVHFFDISTSKSGPELVYFVHFDFEVCFAPQRHAIFHLSSGQMAPHPPL